jgi:hypothetical protein
MPAHDLDIFHPTVASASALHRPRLQGDALTVLCWDERMELHEEAGSSMHPERPDRVRAVMARLQAAELAGRCTRLPAREATPAEVQACHIPELMEAVDMLSEQARLQGNAGLHFSPGQRQLLMAGHDCGFGPVWARQRRVGRACLGQDAGAVCSFGWLEEGREGQACAGCVEPGRYAYGRAAGSALANIGQPVPPTLPH